MPHSQDKLVVQRNALRGTTVGEAWRSLEHRADDPEALRWLHAEFPAAAGDGPNALSRREFLRIAAAGMVLAGVTGCPTQPAEDIVPSVRSDRAFVPGRPEFFATTLSAGPDVQGVLVKNHMGRPTKIEGNPLHPASCGATSAFAQAEILALYDPQRSQAVMRGAQISTWNNFRGAFGVRLKSLQARGEKGLAVLTRESTSPTLRGQLHRMLEKTPSSAWYAYEPVDNAHVRAAAKSSFAASVVPFYRFEETDVVVSLDSDFLFAVPGSVRYARAFADRRRNRGGQSPGPPRLYVAEPSPTVTGSKADHRLPLRSSDVFSMARALAGHLDALPPDATTQDTLNEDARRWAQAVARDLRAHKGRSLVLAGHAQPPAVHAICWAINDRLENLNRTVVFSKDGDGTGDAQPITALAEQIAGGAVDTLLTIDVNPAYDAPADLRFAERLAGTAFTVHAGLYYDETARLSSWHVPLAHPLESWSDAMTQDGVTSLVQPLILPLYRGTTAHALLGIITEELDETPQALVRAHWRNQYQGSDFEAWWRDALRRGVISEGGNTVEVTMQAGAAARLTRDETKRRQQATGTGELEIRFQPDNTVWDGRHANNPWLQEIPDPITKLCWGNAALVSPATARRLNLANEDVVTVVLGDVSVDAPVWIVPGHCDDGLTLPLGYGRESPGGVGGGVGFNAFPLRTSGALWFDDRANLVKTGRRVALTCTQDHHAMEGRDIVRMVQAGTAAAVAGAGDDAQSPPSTREVAAGHSTPLSLYPEKPREVQQWGMVIDLARCIGCNACTIACQAENNVPVVGAAQVRLGRIMHWIRVDRYFEGPQDHPAIHHQPVPCMHCENAPCELVCPVGATIHSHDGLNEMTYNRCVGTRYCSNNCPYKVRRFNFLDYVDRESPTLAMQRNPDVTVRARGVMEKCTYCVQRIRNAEIAARKENRGIADGEVVTACQQACPTQAIVFGNINDGQSSVAAARRQAHHYGLLTELNTRPRTTYLAGLRNTNPELT